MILKKCILVRNDCFAVHLEADMDGMVVHDTGAGNPYLKRYVQPLSYQDNYNEIIADLGVNVNGNHWNKSFAAGETDRQACVHAFIGKNAKDVIETYETLPPNICCWGVGNGSKGSYNYPPNARIQFEICDDGYKSEEYFYAVMREAQEYCAYTCKQYGWNSDKICCHYEAYQQGYGGNHSDITVWLKTFGKNMNWFRSEVQKLIDNEVEDMTEAQVKKLIEESQPKKYHYFSDLPEWAKAPIMALYNAGLFSGRSATELDLTDDMCRMLVIQARIAKEQGMINY